VSVSCPVLAKYKFGRQTQNTEFHKYYLMEARIYIADRHDTAWHDMKANSRFRGCLANTPKKRFLTSFVFPGVNNSRASIRITTKYDNRVSKNMTTHFTFLIYIQHCKWRLADPGSRAVWIVCLWPLDCWYRGFQSLWGHGFSALGFVVCCVGSGLCDRLITSSDEKYRVCLLIVCDL